jgi:translocation and assembly module TamA
MPNIGLTYAKADDRIYTTHGQKIQLNLRGAQKGLGSNTSFLQGQLNGIFIRQLTERGRIILRGEVGMTTIPSFLEGEFDQLPPSIRFFAGGDHSVRGYDYKSLGPKNVEGDVIGGKNLLAGSVEYEHRLFDKWGVAAFYDVGNAFDGVSAPLKHGAGVGVRWLSPVGAVRIDVAVALSEEDSYPLRLHITVGPDF